jgi:D-serine deaminase-like pyridoxal phosphate-dependent protein
MALSSLHTLIGHPVARIDTPALVIDLDAMQRNLRRMQAFADTHGVRLRPHAKMHKSAWLAQAQMAAGAVGVCVQKVSEAERLLALGVPDVFVTNAFGSLQKYERLAQCFRALQPHKPQISVAVDDVRHIQWLAAAWQAAGITQPVSVFVEIDVGQQRCGVVPGAAAVPLVQAIHQHAALRFGGLQAYHGRAQHVRDAAERQAAIRSAVAAVQATVDALHAAGFAVPLVSGAGTGTFVHEATSGVYGELQAGSYLFMDADYAANQPDPGQPAFEHALFVQTRVMSRQRSTSDDRAVLDAGHKTHAIDSGLPIVWAGHGQPWQTRNGGDEHTVLHGPALPDVGDVVWLVPGHCDPTVNLHDHLIGVRGGLRDGVVERIIAVDARGCVT